jgi:threonylcarbamoyladenosine tRNA methylthiotransferase MtaB
MPHQPPASPPDFIPAAALTSPSAAPPDSFVVAQHAAPARGDIAPSLQEVASTFANDSHEVTSHKSLITISSSDRAQILTGDIFEYHSLLAAPILGGEGNHTRPTLKIQDGCNLRCSYCVIPFVRGKSRSLPPDTVISEILRLTVEQPILAVLPPSNHAKESSAATVEQALLPVRLSPAPETNSSVQPPNQNFQPAREIVLSGINLGTYGRDLSPRVEFEDLLRRILDETPLERLRISSIEPQDVTRDLVEMFATTDRIAQHFHMPLQSGSDRILAAMHRWYRTEHYARRVELIHERLPHAAIGADVITGFPGETEADHAATLAFIERLPFTYLHVFSFSQRPGTKAASLPNQVPGATIKRRARELHALGERKSAAFRASQIGRTLRVLTLRRDLASSDVSADAAASSQIVSSSDTREHNTPALSSNFLRVLVPGTFPANQWMDVCITSQEGNCLVGASLLPETLLCETSFASALLR